MNRILLSCIHPFVWLYRFRHRCGYGVHSPFAFHFITDVIYQRLPYYRYKDLAIEERIQLEKHGKDWLYESRKIRRLLFRLVNYCQPHTVVDAGYMAASSLYLKAAREGVAYKNVTDVSELPAGGDWTVDFLYVHDYRRPDFVEAVFRRCVQHATPSSLFVVEGIGYTHRMRHLWRQMQREATVGITFDLFDLGILFFDRTKVKQSYVVNYGC